MKLILAMACTVPLFAQELLPPPAIAAPTVTLEGSISDSHGQPISDRILTLESNAGTSTARSDASGHYKFEKIPPGSATLATGTASGYIPERKKVSLAVGVPSRVDMRLHKAPILAGRVVDLDKSPVAGVFVRARQQGYLYGLPATTVLTGAVTNGLGEFRIVVAGTGKFSVHVETKRRNFQVLPDDLEFANQEPGVMDVPTYYAGSAERVGATLVTLRPDDVVEGMQITLLRGRTVCVAAKVVVPGEEASRQVSLTIAEAYPGSQSIVASGAVPNGKRVQACGISAGLYEISASTMSGIRLNASELVFVADKPQETPTLYLGPQAAITGRVTVKENQDGKKIDVDLSRIYVVGIAADGLAGNQIAARMDAAGGFTLADVAPRDYRLMFLGLPPHIYVQAASIAGHDVYHGVLRPEPGELTVTLAADGPTVSGTVVDADGHPVPDASVVLAAWPLRPTFGPNQLVSVRAGSMGEFILTGAPPGEYKLFAFAGVGISSAGDPAFFQPYAIKGVDLDLTPGVEKAVRPLAIDAGQ